MPRFAICISVAMFATLFLASNLSSHDLSDIDLIMNCHSGDNAQEGEHSSSFKMSSEVKLFAVGAIRLYQLFVSSQQAQVCVFTPSCSHFSMESIKQYGFFQGILMTGDRLMRCNVCAYPYYDVDSRTDLLIDPVVNNALVIGRNGNDVDD